MLFVTTLRAAWLTREGIVGVSEPYLATSYLVGSRRRSASNNVAYNLSSVLLLLLEKPFNFHPKRQFDALPFVTSPRLQDMNIGPAPF